MSNLKNERSHHIILHLSDIHLGTSDQAQCYFTQLATDLTENLKVQQLNYLVISGDIANYSTVAEYHAAFEMVARLMERYALTLERVVIVPGNHDLNWDLSKKAYNFVYKSDIPKSLNQGHSIDAGEAGALIRVEERYQQRFKHFSDEFYQKVYSKDYPLAYDQQAILHPYPQDKILFLALNSCWELDHHYKNRSSINPTALSKAIDKILGNYDDWLKIAVWHHPVNSSESMENTAFLEQLAVNGFQIGMHGHIHEAKAENFQYDTNRGLYIIAAGTFGAPAKEQVPGIPLQYNLLVLNPDNGKLTVKTRKKEKADGAWSADARWGDKNNPVPWYTIPLKYGSGEKKSDQVVEPLIPSPQPKLEQKKPFAPTEIYTLVRDLLAAGKWEEADQETGKRKMKKVALLIGLKDEGFGEELRNKFDFQEVEFLPNPTSWEMKLAIEEIFTYRQEDDLILLFFSGYGFIDEGNVDELYLATNIHPSNVKGNRIKKKTVSASFLQKVMSNSRSRQPVVILNCYMDRVPSENSSENLKKKLEAENEGKERIVLLNLHTCSQE